MERHRLGVFENWVLRATLGPKMDEETGDWMKWHIEEVQEFYLPYIVLVIK
jgi:hypothetical protein